MNVTPVDGPRYTGPVHLLIFSDTLDRKLPNGWSITLGNEDYRAPDGRS